MLKLSARRTASWWASVTSCEEIPVCSAEREAVVTAFRRRPRGLVAAGDLFPEHVDESVRADPGVIKPEVASEAVAWAGTSAALSIKADGIKVSKRKQLTLMRMCTKKLPDTIPTDGAKTQEAD